MPTDDDASEMVAFAQTVARLRARVEELEDTLATAAVHERAKGVLMGRDGLSAGAAGAALARGAGEQGRTVTEECWSVLGGDARRGPSSAPPLGTLPRTPDTGPGRRAPEASAGRARVLAELAGRLEAARTHQDAARALLGGLRRAAAVAGVLWYGVEQPSGDLVLRGHAGVEGAAVHRSRIPATSGHAAVDAARGGRPVWEDDAVREPAGPAPLGGPAGRRAGVAWVPVAGADATTGVVGYLPAGPAPFTPAARTLLREAALLAGGLLRTRFPGAAPGPAAAIGTTAANGAAPGAAPAVGAVPYDGPVPAAGRAGPGGPADAGSAVPDASVVQAVLDTLPMPAVLLTPLWSPDGDVADYRIDAAAPESVDSVGRRGREMVGRRVLETYPTVAGTDLWRGYRDALLTGVPYESESFTYEEVAAGAPSESSYTVRATRLGGRLVVTWACHDPLVREARRLHQMEHLGDLGWAEWNLLTGEATWSEQAYRILGRDPADGPVSWEELALHVVPEDVPQLTEAAGRLRDAADPVDRTFRITTGAGVRHVRFVAEAVTDPAGAAIEVHALYQDLTAQRRAEQALLESERAFLVQQGLLQAERALAKSLQEALLPRQERRLTVAGLRTEVFYLPSEEGLSVGGDWYSAIGLPDGSGLFVIGDVAGHGIGAVATMAQLRFTAKGMIVTGSPLPDALMRLNALLLHAAEGRHTTATMILARYQPWDRTMTWVQAGHLPPLLVRDGTARFLEPPAGIILGATAECRYEEQRFTLEAGDHLLLYTDGLVERPAEDIAEGLARLAAVAAGAVGDEQGAEHLTLRLTADLSPTRRDDVCLLHLGPPEAD